MSVINVPIKHLRILAPLYTCPYVNLVLRISSLLQGVLSAIAGTAPPHWTRCGTRSTFVAPQRSEAVLRK